MGLDRRLQQRALFLGEHFVQARQRQVLAELGAHAQERLTRLGLGGGRNLSCNGSVTTWSHGYFSRNSLVPFLGDTFWPSSRRSADSRRQG